MYNPPSVHTDFFDKFSSVNQVNKNFKTYLADNANINEIKAYVKIDVKSSVNEV